MPQKTTEKALESQIVEEFLVEKSGYLQRPNTKYDKKLCLDPEQVYSFIIATQPEEWEKLKKQHGEDVKNKFFKRLSSKIEKEGVLQVLRKGIIDLGCHFDLFYAKPSTTMNETYRKKYEANLFSVMRQVYFSEQNNKSVDLVAFINGLPIICVELKNHLSGQTVWDAVKQYRTDRDPREPFFKFKRLLVNFAVDEDLVYMATKLEGLKTYFLPFNKGENGGAGNPPTDGFKTEYLWKEILQKESLSELIKKYINTQEIYDEDGRPTGEQILVFPRYHQMDAVRKIISDTRSRGTGKNYLIQHSAGSGKSMTIAWSAHQLTELHNNKNEKIFDSVIVVTDRRVLDKQLQRTIQEFEQKTGVVAKIEKGSKQLKEALEQGKKIIITTLQKFPYIADDIKKLPSRNFAV
ncbi:MAG: type I restriction endonuclease, partial [bacterium]